MNLERQPEIAAETRSEALPVWDRLAASCESFEQAPFLPLYVASVLYIYVAAALSMRPLWLDELYTYYIAKAPTAEQFFAALARYDANPPLQGALTMLAMHWFGDSNFAVRIPSMLAFWLASICVFQFVSYRLGRFYGFAAMLALWSTAFFRYASEARPYALVTASLAVAMVTWQRSEKRDGRVLWLVGIAVGTAGVLMSHIFGSVALIPLGVAEVVRSFGRRKVDWPVWIAFASPAPCLLVYLPIIRQYGQLAPVYPPEFQASILKGMTFYGDVISGGSIALLVAVAAALIIPKARNSTGNVLGGLRRPELTLCGGLLLVPFAIDLILMRRGAAFWPRYGIVSGIGIGAFFAHFLARATRMNRLAGATAGGVLLAAFAAQWLVEPALQARPRVTAEHLILENLKPELPLVIAGGATFLEIDHRKSDTFLSRVFYLTDHDAALHNAHANIFETFDNLRLWAPIRAHVEPYRTFVKTQYHFLLLCATDSPEEWLIPKLMDDGNQLRFLGTIDGGFDDSTIFEVIAPNSGNTHLDDAQNG